MVNLIPIGLLLVISILLAGAILLVTRLFGPNNPLAAKTLPYECGVKGEGSARTPFKSSFYLIAVMFLLFDVEASFFLPWALIYRESIHEGPGLLLAMLAYLALTVIGLIYILRKVSLRLN